MRQDMDASPLGSGPPDNVINGTRFSPHLILLLSELSGPKTIINSQSSVNPLTRSFHPTHPPTPSPMRKRGREREEEWWCVFETEEEVDTQNGCDGVKWRKRDIRREIVSDICVRKQLIEKTVRTIVKPCFEYEMRVIEKQGRK